MHTIPLVLRALLYLLGFMSRRDFERMANNLIATINAEFAAYKASVDAKLAALETAATAAEQQTILDSIRAAQAALNTPAQ